MCDGDIAMSVYEVVYPLGKRSQATKAALPRPRTLDGVTIGELSNYKFDSGFAFETIERSLKQRFPTVKFVAFERFGDTYGPRESDVIRELPDKLKQYECDVVISGMAG
jgi:hypothetical protein